MEGYYAQQSHTCNYCNKILPTYGDLVQHKKTHVGDRPFSCHICHKRFTQKAHLNIHKRTHTGEKPYACPVCHKRFAQSSHLNSHRRIHAEDRPYFCVKCNTGFSQKHRFDTHLPCMQQSSQLSSARFSSPAFNSAQSFATAAAASMATFGVDGGGGGVVGGGGVGGGVGMDGEEVDQKPDIRYLESLNQQALMQQLAEFSAIQDRDPQAGENGDSRLGNQGERHTEGETERNRFLGDVSATTPTDKTTFPGDSGVMAVPNRNSFLNEESFVSASDRNSFHTDGNAPVTSRAEPRSNMSAACMPSVSSHRRKPAVIRHVDNEDNPNNSSYNNETADTEADNSFADNAIKTETEDDDPDEPTVTFPNTMTNLNERIKNGLANSGKTSCGPVPANTSLLATRISPAGEHNTESSTDDSVPQGRTNHRISLVNFTADELLRHMASRADIHRCDFCRIIFQDAAMYHIHRNMHDKNDLRCCNFCGKMLQDRYDFTAHFLNEHR